MYDLGIVGGMGTQATAVFFDILTAHTAARKDSEHVCSVILNRADTPDRTRFILGKSKDDPFPFLADCLQTLNTIGVRAVAVPCNTAHCFYEKMRECSAAPVLNMVELTKQYVAGSSLPKKLCVLATQGTVQSGVYERFGNEGLSVGYPDEVMCREVQHIIEDVKDTAHADIEQLSRRLAAVMGRTARACEEVTYVLACTELSVLDKRFFSAFSVVDAMDILALVSIEVAGKKMSVGSLPYDGKLIAELARSAAQTEEA